MPLSKEITPDIEAVGRRAVSWPDWRWMPGMLHRYRNNSTRVTEENVGHSWSGWPDFSDPATKGCMLALCREARGEPAFHVRLVERAEAVNPLRWNAYVDGWIRRAPIARCDTEAEALVLAWEMAAAGLPAETDDTALGGEMTAAHAAAAHADVAAHVAAHAAADAADADAAHAAARAAAFAADATYCAAADAAYAARRRAARAAACDAARAAACDAALAAADAWSAAAAAARRRAARSARAAAAGTAYRAATDAALAAAAAYRVAAAALEAAQ